MSSNQITQVYQIGDRTFATKAEANSFIRRPAIEAAFKKLTQGNAELASWLIEHQEQVEMAFEVGTIRRVTKSEANKLAKAVAELKKLTGVDFKGISFLVENADAITDSFRWPSVKRMTAEEKTTAARNTLVAASDNTELADWVIANEAAVLEAYEAGKEKREVNPKASEALAAYRAKMDARKKAEEAAKAEGPEAHAAFLKARAEQDAADKAAKDAAAQTPAA